MLFIEYIGFSVVFLIMVLMDFFGNIMVVLVVFLNKFMKIFMNWFMLNLVFVDMVVVVFVVI